MKNLFLTMALGLGILACGNQKTNAGAKFACPMHPEITSDTMMKCPECGMDLEPVKKAGSDTTKVN